jgi:hypothetical protein
VDFDIIGVLIKFSLSIRYWRKNGSIVVQYISCQEISRKPRIQLGEKYYTVFY